MIPDNIRETIKKNNGAVPDDLFNEYPPEEHNRHKENLLTIYLNEGIGVYQIDKFLDKGYKIQDKKILPKRWDMIIESISHRSDFEEIFQKMFKKNRKNLAYILLKLPTCHKFNFFFRLHKQGYQYEQHKIMLDIFSNQAIDYDMHEDMNKWKSNMAQMVNCFKTMIKENILHLEAIRTIDDVNFKKMFQKHIFYVRDEFVEYQAMKKGNFNYNTENTECDTFVRNLRATLEKEYYDVHLSEKEEVKQKISRTKI